MTDHELLTLCRDHFLFLRRLSQVPRVTERPKDGSKGKRISSRTAIGKECLAAVEKLDAHFAAEKTVCNQF
jgi:hypothetical protein